MKKNKVYIGGALFKEGDIKQRIYEASELRKVPSLEVFNPIESPVNDKAKLPNAIDIFRGDTDQVISSKYLLAELDAKIDEGLVAEIAIAWARNDVKEELMQIIRENSKDSLYDALRDWILDTPRIEIVAHASDIRLKTAGEYNSIKIPVGYNQYVIGMLCEQGHFIGESVESAIDLIKQMEETHEKRREEDEFDI